MCVLVRLYAWSAHIRTIEVEVISDKPWKNPSSSVMSHKWSDVSLVMKETAFPHSLDAAGLRVSHSNVSSSICGSMHIEHYIQETREYCETIKQIIKLA